MKTVHWAEVQREVLATRADQLVRLAFILLGAGSVLTATVAVLSRFREHAALSLVIFGMAVGAVLLLLVAFGLLLPLPFLVHQLKEMDNVIADQTRRRY
jgi:hypothetical protein